MFHHQEDVGGELEPPSNMQEELFQGMCRLLINAAIDKTQHCRISEMPLNAQWSVVEGVFERHQGICGM